ncbi:MAG: type II toxin-antitoxin system HicA family toxin [Bacteroidota bacterium]|nr:type II toxin-antitoxin system HicA family toxin [Bacteroidota bacterium]
MYFFNKLQCATKFSYICSIKGLNGNKRKAGRKVKKQPKDFTFDELIRLFQVLGFEISQKGKTSGSRVEFVNPEKGLSFGAHKPHPASAIKACAMKQILEFLTLNKLI